MRVLALRGAHVLGAARSARKGRQACESVQGNAEPLLLELTDFDSIVTCSEQVEAIARPLDRVLNGPLTSRKPTLEGSDAKVGYRPIRDVD